MCTPSVYYDLVNYELVTCEYIISHSRGNVNRKYLVGTSLRFLLTEKRCAEKYTSCILPLDSGTNVWYNMIYIYPEQTFFTILWEPKSARRVHGSIEMSMSRKYIFDYYAFKSFRFFLSALFKSVSILLRSMMQSPAHITKNAVKNVWKHSKSAPTDRCYPISVSTTRFGLSKQEHFTFVSFHGQSLRPWRQAHDSFRNIYFTLSCFLLRNREISRTLHAIPFKEVMPM